MDRRITRIFLTEKGVGLRKSIKSMVVSFNENVIKNISDDELTTYNKVTEVIKQQIDFELNKRNK
jgi:DNA-binding MarR family transcriptional regulator